MKKMLWTMIVVWAVVSTAQEAEQAVKAETADKAYNVIMFGDLHYDNMDCHDEKKKEERKSEFTRNVNHWNPEKGLAWKIIKAAASKVNDETAFALQVGDVTQGDGKTLEAAMQLFKEVIAELTKPFGKTPVYIVKGNHDYRSPGGRKAFAEAVVPYLKTILPEGAEIKNSNYAVEHGPDLFLFLDLQVPDFEFAKKTLEAHPNIRHLFVINHLPFIPNPGGRPSWTLFHTRQQPEVTEKQLEFRKMVAKRNGIMLAGHIHANSLTDYKREGEGRITQITVSSMGSSKKRTEFPKPTTEYSSAVLKALELTNPKVAKYMEEFRPYVVKHERFGDSGYGIIKINGEHVTFELYRADTTEKPGVVWELR
ncbi:MAG: metallophosphoesterase [Victivallales bacterium]|nr:metallophosphoesterase [Victivallales bacterium]